MRCSLFPRLFLNTNIFLGPYQMLSITLMLLQDELLPIHRATFFCHRYLCKLAMKAAAPGACDSAIEYLS